MEKQSRKETIIGMLETEPQDVFLNYALAMEFLAENDFINVELQLQKTLHLKEDYLPCYYQLGQVYEKLNDANSAISYYQKGVALAKKTNNTKALNELNEAIWLLED